MKVDKTKYTEQTFTVKLPYDEILDLLKQEGAVFERNPAIEISMVGSKSSLASKLGTFRSPTQSLRLSVTVEEKHDESFVE